MIIMIITHLPLLVIFIFLYGKLSQKPNDSGKFKDESSSSDDGDEDM